MFELIANQEQISLAFFINAFIGAALLSIFFVASAQLMSSYLSRGQVNSLGSGLVFVSWLMDSLSGIEGYPEILKQLSPFYYYDEASLAETYELSPELIVVLLAATVTSSWTYSFIERRISISSELNEFLRPDVELGGFEPPTSSLQKKRNGPAMLQPPSTNVYTKHQYWSAEKIIPYLSV